MPHAAGQIAGRYTIEAELARGGMGVVYRALDAQTGRRVALKQARVDARRNVDGLLQREFHTLVQLRHPRIIEVDDYGVDAGAPFYTMELLDGADLGDLSPLDHLTACRHLRDVASSLALLHARRLLHRDVSPRNVRITGDGRAKLIDFGALVTFGSAPQVVGTPPGVPPEALHGMPLDQRADLYGLGALAYYVLTGRQAYPATGLRALPLLWEGGPPPPPSTLVPGLPPALDALVLSLLSLDVLGRPRSAADVADQLNTIAQLPPEEALEVGSSYLSNPQLVGRAPELARIDAQLAALASGQGAGLLIGGREGVGRSRLLAEGVLRARLAGVAVAQVDAELHRGPYGTLRALLEALMSTAPAALAAAGPHAAWLAHLVPGLADLAGVEPIARLPLDRAEQNARVRQAAVGLLRAVATERPLLLAVDNAQAADDSSLSVLASHAREAWPAPIALWLTVREGATASAQRRLDPLAAHLPHVELRAFCVEETTALVRALFGPVDHAGRLGRWLHDCAAGNPAHCIALASRLVDSGDLRYLDGAWVLPADPQAELADPRLEDLHEQLLAGLSAEARALVEDLSVEQGSIALERALGLSRAGSKSTFASLTELAAHGTLLADDEGYRFSHGGLRAHLFSSLSEVDRRALHRRAAELSLRHADADPLAQIEAGFHLVHAGDERRGAELLDRAARKLVVTVEGLRFAAPALETALRIYEREGESAWEQLPLLNALTAAGWYVDYRYVAEYGERTLQLALDLMGLTRAHKLARVVGDRAAVKLGVGAAALRHAAAKKHIRSSDLQSFEGVARPLIGTVGITVGAAATMLDGAGARHVLDRVRLMPLLGDGQVLSVMYDYCRYYTLAAEGRLGEAEKVAPAVLAWFRSPEGIAELGEEGARALSGGLLCGMAQFLSFRDGADTEQWAQALEDLGQSFYEAMAAQSRFVYHTARGEAALALRQVEALDRHAMRAGTTWQSALVLPLLTAACTARTEDVSELRRALEELERRSEHVPCLRAYVEVYRAQAELLAGQAPQALSRIEQVASTTRPHVWFDWVFAAATHARALAANGQTARAWATVREAESHLEPSLQPYAMFSTELELTALQLELQTGALAAARTRAERLIDTHRATGSPLTLVRLYAARCQVALAEEDQPALQAALPALDLWARRSENPALIALLRRTLADAGRRFPNGASDTAETDLLASGARSRLQQTHGEARAAAALRLALDAAGATAGHLFLLQAGSLHHAVAQPPNEPIPAGFEDQLRLLTEATVVDSEQGVDPVTAVLARGEVEEGWHLEWLVAPGAPAPAGALMLKPREGSHVQPLGEPLLRALVDALGTEVDTEVHPPQPHPGRGPDPAV